MRDIAPSREAEFVSPRPTPLFGTDRAEEVEAAAAHLDEAAAAAVVGAPQAEA